MRISAAQQMGFTLVELMVTIVILGILLAIGVVQLSSASTRARDAATKTNMHAFQTVVEIYAVNYNGIYPASVSQLAAESTLNNERTLYQMRNAYGYGAGINNSYTDESNATKVPGVVSFQFDGAGVGYTLYGYNKNSNKIGSKGVTYMLSNH